MPPKICKTIQEAVHHTVHCAGKDLKEVAPAVDYSPSNLSQRSNLFENPQYPYPLSKAVPLMECTDDDTILFTLCDLRGYERPNKKPKPVPQEEVRELKEQVGRLMEQLNLFFKSQQQQSEGAR
jgi:hypothetical protein